METTISKRSFAGFISISMGVMVLLTSLMVNPWLGKLFSLDYECAVRGEYLLGYFIWSMSIGIILIAVGFTLSRKKIPLLDKVTLTLLVFSMFFLLDRLLLVKWGETRWRYDPLILYRNRPYAVLKWKLPQYVTVQLNRYGFNNGDFPVEKPPGEYRVLALGDSITLGHGVPSSDNFCSQLECLLDEKDCTHTSHLVINTGVQGYATYQEWQILKESMRFEPDFVVIGFCMNDLTEPFRVNRTLGGTGFDYHNISQTENPVIGWLYNETGFGRLIQKARERKLPFVNVKKFEVNDIKSIAAHAPDDEEKKKKWQLVQGDLAGIYHTAEEHRLGIVLLIFPFTFQLTGDEYDYPQGILKQQAALHGVDVLDFTAIFRDIVREEAGSGEGKKEQASGQDGEKLYKAVISRYFLDEDHLTPEGHRIVAQKVFEYMLQKVLNK